MAQSDHLPDALHGEAQKQEQSGRYLYVVKHPDTSVYYTNHERQISVTNLPTAWRHGSPQVFDPVQIRHGQVSNQMEYGEKKTVIQVSTQDTKLRRYFLEAPAAKIDIAIIYISADALNEESPGSLDYDRHCQVVQSGSLGAISIADGTIYATVTPLAFDPNAGVPRHNWQRLCNHMLYDPKTCFIGARNHMLDTTIASIDRVNRSFTVNSVHAADTFYGGGGAVGGSIFTHGYIFHEATGQRFGTVSASFVPATSTTFILDHWQDLLEVSDAVECFWGCDRTTDHCKRFNNLTMFGGNPYIPSDNPTINGAGP